MSGVNPDCEIEKILSEVDDTYFEESDWNNLAIESKSLSAQWDTVAVYIGLEPSKISEIGRNNSGDCTRCWNSALLEWIRNVKKFGEPSWRTFLKAVALVDNETLFKKLAADHPVKDKLPEPMEASATDSSFNESKGAEGGTPDTAEPGKAPSSPTSSLSPEQKQRRYEIVSSKSQEMGMKFQKLFTSTKKSLREEKVPVSELVGHLECLGFIKPTFKDTGLSPLRHQLPKLKSAQHVDDVMSVVKDYCSFFNYHIVAHIIEEFGTPKDKDNLAAYKKDFEEYAQCCVVEGSMKVGEMSEEGFSNMFVTLDDSFDNCTLSHLNVFITDVRKILNISSDVNLRLCYINHGSVKLTFQLPLSLHQDIFPLSPEQEASLAALGVVELSCGDYQFTRQQNKEVEDPCASDDEGYTDYADSITELVTGDNASMLKTQDFKLKLVSESVMDVPTKSNWITFTGKRSNVSLLKCMKKPQSSFAESLLKTGDFKLVNESQAAEDYYCPVCLSLMNEPHLTNCGHRFCKGCIEPIYHSERKCPICQEPGFKIMPDRDIERRIKELMIRCVNHKNGCDWTGKKVNVDNHLLKQCDYHSVDCKLEVFGCKEKVLRKDQAAHISDNIICHMTMIVEQYDAKQKEYENQLGEKEAKINQLEQRINDFEHTICSELERKSDIKWTPLHPWHEICVINEKTPKGVKQHCVPENTVPKGSKEILVLLATHSEFSWPHKVTSTISVFIEEDGVRYSKFIMVHNFEQPAWNDNTDNVWLPLPTNRVVNVDVPVQFGFMFWCDIHIIGYR